MKKYSYVLVVVMTLGLFGCQQADDDLLSETWWQSATLQKVEQTIARGVNVKARDKDGNTALMFAGRP